ncbi:uncharacterized protein LOC143174694 [Nomia melanderi]|uniref:uncharacterized protein LOC143174694 n=1 Tax=Nomia melanderi TaxID=2448451 RepID=UPI003FCD9DA8
MRRNLPETDRKKNQFDKEERVHLLSLMKQYAPLLDKSTSTLARRKIWATIENEFKQMGFTRKTSAQLKKYWQNYKYHCKKAKAMGKDSKKCGNSSSATSESPEWNRHRIKVEHRSTPKFPEIPAPITDRPGSSPIRSRCRTIETCEDSVRSFWKSNSSDDVIDSSRIKTEREDEDWASNDYTDLATGDFDERSEIGKDQRKTKNRIVVSNAKISNNSVTVSVLYPEDNERVSRSVLDETHESHSDTVPLNDSTSYGERRSLERTEKDSPCGKHPDEFLKGNPPASVENRGKNAADVPRKHSDAKHDALGSRKSYVFLTDYRNQLKHKLLLQQLETEEKRLKVKIAEMGIQELQLRIKALREDMRRTEELHRLNFTRRRRRRLVM